MPVSHGRFIPERLRAILRSKRLHVVVLAPEYVEDDLVTILTDHSILSDYLLEISDGTLITRIYLVCDRVLAYVGSLSSIVPVVTDVKSDPLAVLSSVAKAVDADVVVSKSAATEGDSSMNHRSVVSNLDDMLSHLEVFARGWDIPWSFGLPFYNLTWQDGFYLSTDEFGVYCQSAYLEKLKGKLPDAETDESARTLLLVRIPFICYSRDKLLHYSQQIRHSARNGLDNQEYRFEVSFYLQSYYTLITGALDQACRVIHSVLGMKKPNYRHANLSNDEFLKNASKDIPGLQKIVSNLDTADWLSKLLEVRHHITHNGVVTASPIYIEPDSELSMGEIDRLVQEEPEYDSLIMLKDMVPRDQYEALLETIRQRVRLRVMDKVVDHSTVIPSSKGSFAVPGLRDITWNFDHLAHTLTEMIDQLCSFIDRR